MNNSDITISNITTLTHELFGDTRFIQEGDSFLVVAKDVVEKIGNTWQPHNSIKHVPEVWKGSKRITTPGGSQTVLTLSEQGLYFYLGRCDKPAALKYQMWIAGEVVPAIRRDGAYVHAQEGDDETLVMARGMLAAKSAIERLEKKIAADAPKVELHDRFLDEGEDISVGALAKKLAQEGLPFGQNRLFEYLRRQKVLCSKRGVNRNMPMQKYIDRGWFKVIAPPRTMMDRWKATAYVTPKGVKEISARIHELFSAVSFN